jgi:hypothetical protein
VSSARNPHWCCYLGTTLDMCTDALSVRMAAFIAEDLPVASGTVRAVPRSPSMEGWGPPVSSRPHLAAGSRALDRPVSPGSPGQG